MPVTMEILSFSALADFWACPRLYHYRHELRLPVPQHQTETRRRGSRIHQQLDLHAQGHTPPMAQDADDAPLWQNYLQAIGPYQGLACFSEWSCHLPLQLQGETIWLHGRMDRLYLDDRTLILLDFKTGCGAPGPREALQLDFYAWLLWQAQSLLAPAGIERIIARALCLAEPDLTLERIYTAANQRALGESFGVLIESMLDAGSRDVPAPRSVAGEPWCTMCEYQRLCPEGSYYAH